MPPSHVGTACRSGRSSPRRASPCDLPSGKALGHVEESFVARLVPGDCFVFAGRVLEFVRVREMTAWVKPAPARAAVVPRWMGAKMALSTLLAERTRGLIAQARAGTYAQPELALVRPLLELQARWSALPAGNEWLVERLATRDGHYLFFYPFEGRLAHLGLADAVELPAVARGATHVQHHGQRLRLRAALAGARRRSASASWAALLAARRRRARHSRRPQRRRARTSALPGDRARRRARVPGLSRAGTLEPTAAGIVAGSSTTCSPSTIPTTRCSRRRRARCWNASSKQPRLAAALARLRASRVVITDPPRPTPFAFPLMVEMFREKLTTEALEARVARMVGELEAAASGG